LRGQIDKILSDLTHPVTTDQKTSQIQIVTSFHWINGSKFHSFQNVTTCPIEGQVVTPSGALCNNYKNASDVFKDLNLIFRVTAKY